MTSIQNSTTADPWGFDPTTTYWQTLLAADDPAVRHAPPYQRGYPAPLPDGRFLVLPLRGVPSDPDTCVASLIANQASFEVVEALSGFMAELARPHAVDAVVGLPTLGLAFAPRVAQLLGFTRFIPFGYSRKYWYEETLSVPVHSLTTPEKGKLLYVDPNLAGSLRGKRVLIVDDAVSSGQTMVSSLQLLAHCGAEVVAIAVAMRQGAVWKERLRQASGEPIPVLAAFDSPRMRKVEGGWAPRESAPAA